MTDIGGRWKMKPGEDRGLLLYIYSFEVIIGSGAIVCSVRRKNNTGDVINLAFPGSNLE